MAEFNHRLEDRRKAVVRNGYLPERQLQTGLGDIPVQAPKVRDRSKKSVVFNSKLVPPYLKRTKNVEELLPWLYLHGISTGEMQPALASLLGKEASGLSAKTVSRLKQQWKNKYDQWRKRDLSKKQYVYLWVDGIYSRVRMDDKLCLLVVMGVDNQGNKALLAVNDGYRESEASWLEVLRQLPSQGLTQAPKLVTGDGAMGFWNALPKVWPTTAAQRCWVHKTSNVLSKLLKSMHEKAREALKASWMAETRKNAHKAFDDFEKRFEAKYPKATACLKKDREEMLVFYDFPAAHWVHIRTTNPIESAFATVRLRTHKTKGCGSRKTTLMMCFKLLETAQNNWQRIRGFKLLPNVIEGVVFTDGIQKEQDSQQKKSARCHTRFDNNSL